MAFESMGWRKQKSRAKRNDSKMNGDGMGKYPGAYFNPSQFLSSSELCKSD